MHGHSCRHGPGQHLLVERLQRVADVHEQDQAAQALPLLQVILQLFGPLPLYRLGDLGEAVAGQIDQALALDELEKVEQLRAARGLGGLGQLSCCWLSY